MIRQLVLTSVLFGTGALIAQPTLTQATNGLVPIVDSYGVTSFTTNTPAEFFPVGAAGPDASYGFWMLDATGGNDRFLVSPSVTPTSSVFPTATVLYTNGGSDTLAYRVTATGIEQVGFRTQIEGAAAFTNSAIELPFPCTYNTAWTDPFSVTYSPPGFPLPITRAGVNTGLADGYGELQLPAATIPEVLRVKVRKVQTETTPLGLLYRSYDSYYYYTTDMIYPALKTSVDTTIIASGTPSVTFTAEWLLGPGNSIGEVSPDQVTFNPYPNPTNGRVDLGLGQGQLRSVEVFTATGQLVATEVKPITGTFSSVLDLSGLPGGVYHLKVTSTEGRTGSRRVVVE